MRKSSLDFRAWQPCESQAWLFSLFNAVLKCDDPALSEWFVNGEMRSVVVDFQ